MTTIAHCVNDLLDNDATTTKRWVLLSPPDGFDVADTTVPAA